MVRWDFRTDNAVVLAAMVSGTVVCAGALAGLGQAVLAVVGVAVWLGGTVVIMR